MERTPAEVAEAVNRAAGERVISSTYVWQLRTGRRDNPTQRHLSALAAFFGVSPMYFFEATEADRGAVTRELVAALKDDDVRDMALRAVGLSERRHLHQYISTEGTAPLPGQQGSLVMSSHKTTPETVTLLSPQLLAQARSCTARQWAARGLCVGADPEIFFPPGEGPAVEARHICGMCPVRGECLAYAVTADEPFGIWGGPDPHERENLRRQPQRREPTAASRAGSAA